MKMGLSATVVVPALNAEHTIRECIKSLINQDYKGAYEVIVIDNGSSDNTMDFLREFCYRKRMLVLKERVRGSYRARNVGIVKAKGKVVVFTDADCVVQRDWLKNLMAPFRDKEVLVVGGMVGGIGSSTAVERYCGRFFLDQERMMNAPSPFFATASMAVRKSAFGRYGLFDGSLRSGGDAEWCGRLPRRSMLYFSPRAMVRHRHPASIWTFVKKQYGYGKGMGHIQQSKKGRFSIRLPSPGEMLRRHGIAFCLLRIAQEASFSAGFWSGKIMGGSAKR